jgi:OOP family OmpA-OmpF porin
MTTFPVRITIIALALLSGPLAFGQSTDWYVAPSIVFTNDDAFRAIDDSFAGFQVSGGRNISDHVSLEALLGYSDIAGYCEPGDCYPDQQILDISVNLLGYYDRDARFAPYALAGVGYQSADADEGPQYVRFTGKGSNPTATFGLGLLWRMGESRYSIRVEHRARVAFDGYKNLTDQLSTFGLQYDFGKRRDAGVPAPTNVDTDGDGVLDMWDACADTPRGVAVTSRGCPIENIDRADDDQDRVLNSVDECPDTPLGTPVDQRGCSQDSDMDGVPTDKDRCPNSRMGAEVNIYGCENDNDKDGVPDHRDSCLFTRPGVRTDVRGCEIKDIISLPGVNFETGEDILIFGTEYLLEEAANTLIKYPELQIEVAGHSDNVGDAKANEGLSERRAKTVRAILIRMGVAEERLTFKGYGETQPIGDNSTAEGRAINRRVELRLISN